MSSPVNPQHHIPPAWQRQSRASRSLLTSTQDASGAWPAAPSFEPYGYSWFRDGSFIAEGAGAAGLVDQARAFHHWCAGVLHREREAVEQVVASLASGSTLPDSAYLPARYNLDGTRHEDDWWNFQVDGYGTWLWALERHLTRTGESVAPYSEAVRIAARYLVATGRRPCRDWWEENRDQTHVATLAGVAAGLRAAVRIADLGPELSRQALATAEAASDDIVRAGVRDGHLVKWLGGTEIDASLLSVAALYDVLPLDHPVVTATVATVEERLTEGGVHRYESDTFYGGGQWPVLASLLAWHHARAGNPRRARELLDWVVSVADEADRLPEQTGPLLAPHRLAEWQSRWGRSAHPLTWSHGMFLAAVHAYEQAFSGSRNA